MVVAKSAWVKCCFDKFTGFILKCWLKLGLIVKKGTSVQDLWLFKSGPNWPKMSQQGLNYLFKSDLRKFSE